MTKFIQPPTTSRFVLTKQQPLNETPGTRGRRQVLDPAGDLSLDDPLLQKLAGVVKKSTVFAEVHKKLA